MFNQNRHPLHLLINGQQTGLDPVGVTAKTVTGATELQVTVKTVTVGGTEDIPRTGTA